MSWQYNTVTLLQTGQVLVAGGDNFDASDHYKNPSELYHPSSNSWTEAANLNGPHYEAAAVLLPSGEVLITGGYDPDPIPGVYTNAVEIYQPVVFDKHIYLSTITK